MTPSPQVLAVLCSQEFMDDCNDKFASVDADANGELSPEELFPVVQYLIAKMMANPWAITMEHLLRFIEVFDADGNGSISAREFYSFYQFLAVVGYLEAKSDAEDTTAAEEVEVAPGSPLTSSHGSTKTDSTVSASHVGGAWAPEAGQGRSQWAGE